MLNQIMRRYFVKGLLGLGGAAAAASPLAAGVGASPVSSGRLAQVGGLGQLFLARSGRSRRSSSWDRQGKNADYVPVEPGQTATIAAISGAGVVCHIWITIAAEEPDYLRRVVLRAYWDGELSPSIESPVGDFFGVGHGRVSNYWSLPLNMVTGGRPATENRAAMNCFFPMPFERGAKLTVENQGEKRIRSLYYQVDYVEQSEPAADALRFHAVWHRQNPTRAQLDLSDRSNTFPKTNEVVNLDGQNNYVILEARGRGHYVGCNLSIDHINPIPNFGWFGEGDDMIYIDGDAFYYWNWHRRLFLRRLGLPWRFQLNALPWNFLRHNFPCTCPVPRQVDDVSLPHRGSDSVQSVHQGDDRGGTWQCSSERLFFGRLLVSD